MPEPDPLPLGKQLAGRAIPELLQIGASGPEPPTDLQPVLLPGPPLLLPLLQILPPGHPLIVWRGPRKDHLQQINGIVLQITVDLQQDKDGLQQIMESGAPAPLDLQQLNVRGKAGTP